MFNKIYAFLKSNRKEIIIFLAFFVLFNIRFPYYIDSPGGTISLKKKFEIADAKEINGDISLVYVAERPATIPSLLLSLVLKDWDILKKEDVLLSNETDKDGEVRGKVTLDQSLNNAIVYAFQKAGKEIEILSSKVYVVYVLEEAKTDLKVGDQILYINDEKILERKDVADILAKLEVNDEISIKVLANDKEVLRKAKIIDSEGSKKIGIGTTIMYDYKLSQDVKYEKKGAEMGSSGGFANTLYIYSSLIDEDIIKGRKIVGTGTIDSEGIVGPIGGVKYKLKAASKKADLFFISDYNCKEAMAIKKEKNYNLNIVCVKTFDEAIDYLKKN